MQKPAAPRLHAFHRRFALLERPVARASVVGEAAAAAVLAVAAWDAAWRWAAAVLRAAGGGVALACAHRLARTRPVRPESAV